MAAGQVLPGKKRLIVNIEIDLKIVFDDHTFISSNIVVMESVFGFVSCKTTFPTSGSSCNTVSFDGSTVKP